MDHPGPQRPGAPRFDLALLPWPALATPPAPRRHFTFVTSAMTSRRRPPSRREPIKLLVGFPAPVTPCHRPRWREALHAGHRRERELPLAPAAPGWGRGG